MPEFKRAIACEELPPGEGVSVDIEGTKVALFNVDGAFHAVDNWCPHAGAPLGDAFIEDAVVCCPFHGWKFDVCTGECTTVSGVRLARFETKVEDGAVWVAVRA